MDRYWTIRHAEELTRKRAEVNNRTGYCTAAVSETYYERIRREYEERMSKGVRR
jgi:hypothetical protein